MKTYTVKEIADLVDTNPETVRRWIRSGKLCADQLSRKEGNIVHEEDLYKFLRSTSKYSAIAEAMIAGNVLLPLSGIAAGVGLLAGALLAGNKKQNVAIHTDDVKKAIVSNIEENNALISRKKAAIKDLQDEIIALQKQIEDYKLALDHLWTETDKEENV